MRKMGETRKRKNRLLVPLEDSPQFLSPLPYKSKFEE
jgi:hypothetical protein